MSIPNSVSSASNTSLIVLHNGNGSDPLSQGADRWKGSDKRSDAGETRLGDESPYQRVIGDAWMNVSAWLTAEREGPVSRRGRANSKPTVGNEQKQAYMEALKEIHNAWRNHP